MNENKLCIKWDSKFATGITHIDNQHKTLIQLCSDLYSKIMKKQKETSLPNNHWQESLTASLKQCVSYVKYHFSFEEKLMTDSKYSELDKHKKEHLAFTKKVLETAQKYQTWEFKDALDFVKFLYDWILSHIAIEDKKYKKDILNYLNALKQNNPDNK